MILPVSLCPGLSGLLLILHCFFRPNISILTDLIRSVEAKVARRNSLASVPNLNESTEAGSPFALARRSLSAQLQLQVGLVPGLLFEATDDSILFF